MPRIHEFGKLGYRKGTISPSSAIAMKAETAAGPFSRPGWVFEVKLDGYRLLVEKGEGGVRLWTRNQRDITRRFPEIAGPAADLPFSSFVLDGELVILDDEGRPSFQALQRRAQRSAASPGAIFFAFDVLSCEGYDLRPLPLTTRKEILAAILAAADQEAPLRLVEAIPGRGEDVYRAAVALELEGVVAKRADSPYSAGYSADWQKIRVDQVGDFAVVGFAPSGGGSVRGLHLGLRSAEGFAYAGSVGTGFTVKGAADLRTRLEPARRETPPVTGAPPEKSVVWVEPELVAEVRYKERTAAGSLRHPVFLRLRDDKSPAECFLRPARVDPGMEEAREEAAGAEPKAAKKAGAVTLTHADKVFWPEEGYTKGDLFEYYRAIHPWIAPYLADRPLVVDRYPDGIAGKSFFQKSIATGQLPGVETVTLKDDGRVQEYFLCPNEASLLALVNLGVIPLHASASRAAAYDRPDWCILDLDPKTAPWEHVVEIALALFELCEGIGLPSFPKTSGGSGLHILLPLGGLLTHEQSRQLAELLARLVSERLPEIATTARSIAARRGRVYIDALQNGRGKLLAAPFSARPRPGATVSAPLPWDEVSPEITPRDFTIVTLPRLMKERGEDPLLPVLTLRPDFTAALSRLMGELDEG